MGARYGVSRTAALSTTADLLTIIAPMSRALKVSAIRIEGQGTTSAANEVAVARSTGGVTPSVSVLPVPLSAGAPPPATFALAGWSTQPTLGQVIDRIGVNANGANAQRLFGPGQEIEIPPGGQLSFRALAGSSSVTLSAVIEEVG